MVSPLRSFPSSPSSSSLLLQGSPTLLLTNLNFIHTRRKNVKRNQAAFMAASDLQHKPPKLVTFLGKGGSGKTTAAVLAAQYYAKTGLRTCLVIHSQDLTAEYLIGCKIGTSPTTCNNRLSAFRLETTKMLLEPLDRLKKADTHLNLTQGILQGVVGEELGVLPGMDSIFSTIAVEKLVQYLDGLAAPWNFSEQKFDVIVYDGISTEDTLRMIGASNRVRLYLKYIRSMAEKTDIGRLTAPSILKLVNEAMKPKGGSVAGERSSTELWVVAERALERAAAAFLEPSKFGCYLVMDVSSKISVSSALRYWGCAIQAGVHVSGSFGFTPKVSTATMEATKQNLSPLAFSLVPYLSNDSSINWDETLNVLDRDAQNLLCGGRISAESLVKFDPAKKSVTLFMPGFDKSEIKLYQYRGGSDLLVEAGDQRRVIPLPSGIQGKVGGAKFVDRNLVITLQ